MTYIDNGSYYIVHSRYYSQWVAYSPHLYWNVVTDDDLIPVCTHGYANVKSSQQQIKKYISNVKECRLLHTETKEEHDIEMYKTISMIRSNYCN